MPLQVVCLNPKCRKSLMVKDELAGQTLRCPACKAALSPSSSVAGGARPASTKASISSKPAKDRPTVQTSSAAKSTSVTPPAKQSLEGSKETGSAPLPKKAPGGRNKELPAAIGHYQVSRELGRGAFGVVYQGHDSMLNRDVAIKVLKKEALNSAKAVERFLREAQVVAQMHYNRIVPVYELGEHDGCHYIASRFVPGQTLADLIPDEGMEPAEAVKLVLQLLEALAYAHEMGVLHRDVKPANAIVDAKGHLCLMDFGLAGWVGQTEGRATQDGTVMGTPAYMPPEQARGDIQHLSAAADQYSAGVVLYELLTGRLPFEGGPLLVQLHNVIETPPPPPSEFRPGLDQQLEALCLRALAKKPEERFPSCQEFAEALRTWQVCHGPSSAVVVVPIVEEGPQDVIPLQAVAVPAQETAVRVPEPPRRRKARRPPKEESFLAKMGDRRWIWLLAVGGTVGGVLLCCLVGLWASGVFKVKTKEGVLAVAVNEPNAEVYVDGEKVTVTWAEGGKKAEIRVRPGTHQVEVKKAGFTAAGETVTLSDGGRKVFTASLSRVPPDTSAEPKKDPVASAPKPIPVDPPPALPPEIGPAARRVYLSDLVETNWSGNGSFAKNDQDYWGPPLSVNGVRFHKGLGTHPPPNGYATVQYRLSGLDAAVFVTKVAINDSAQPAAGALLTFQVLGDGKVLWTAAPMRATGQTQECRITVKDVRVLELRVYCPNRPAEPVRGRPAHHAAHSVWLDPYLMVAAPDGKDRAASSPAPPIGDPWKQGSIWTGTGEQNPGGRFDIKVTVLKRDGNAFEGRYEVFGGQNVIMIKGTVSQTGAVAWRFTGAASIKMGRIESFDGAQFEGLIMGKTASVPYTWANHPGPGLTATGKLELKLQGD